MKPTMKIKELRIQLSQMQDIVDALNEVTESLIQENQKLVKENQELKTGQVIQGRVFDKEEIKQVSSFSTFISPKTSLKLETKDGHIMECLGKIIYHAN